MAKVFEGKRRRYLAVMAVKWISNAIFSFNMDLKKYRNKSKQKLYKFILAVLQRPYPALDSFLII